MQSHCPDGRYTANALYKYNIGKQYIGISSRHVTNPLFESAATKLQENCSQNLTVAEKEAVKWLMIEDQGDTAVAESKNYGKLFSMEERHLKLRNLETIP